MIANEAYSYSSEENQRFRQQCSEENANNDMWYHCQFNKYPTESMKRACKKLQSLYGEREIKETNYENYEREREK